MDFPPFLLVHTLGKEFFRDKGDVRPGHFNVPDDHLMPFRKPYSGRDLVVAASE